VDKCLRFDTPMTIHQSKAVVLKQSAFWRGLTVLSWSAGKRRILFSKWMYEYAVATGCKWYELLSWGEREYTIIGTTASGTHVILEDNGPRRRGP
jgi:hypothetical protein